MQYDFIDDPQILAALIGGVFLIIATIITIKFSEKRTYIENDKGENISYKSKDVDQIIKKSDEIIYNTHIGKFSLKDILSHSIGAFIGKPSPSDNDIVYCLIQHLNIEEEEIASHIHNNNNDAYRIGHISDKILSDLISLNIISRHSWVTDMYSGTEYYLTNFGRAVIKKTILEQQQ